MPGAEKGLPAAQVHIQIVAAQMVAIDSLPATAREFLQDLQTENARLRRLLELSRIHAVGFGERTRRACCRRRRAVGLVTPD
jgi:hypothetical protein